MHRLRLPRSTPLEQQAALIGMIVAALAAAAIAAETLASSDFDWVRPIAPAAVSLLFGVGVVTRRAIVVPAAAAGLLLSTLAGFFVPDNRAVIYIAYIIFAAVFATFGRHRITALNISITGLAFVSPWMWGAGPAVTIMAGGGAGITGYLIGRMRSTIESERRRSEAVLDLAPVMIMEQDWGAVVEELDRMRSDGVTDLAAAFDADPGLVSSLVAMVEPRFANRAALDAYGVDDQDAYVRRYKGPDRPLPTVNDRSYEGYRAHLLSIWDRSSPRSLELASYDFQGEPWWTKVHWVEHPDGNGLAIIAAADITELKKTQAVMEEVNRSKDRFVASVSHELRTPLAAVVGFSNELVERGAAFSPEEVEDILATIRDEAQEAAHLIEDLLVVARADMGQVSVTHEPVDLQSVVIAVQKSLHTDIEVLVEGGSQIVCGDGLRVRQIVRNLITNTLRYGGETRSIRLRSHSGIVVLEVEDDGTSLSEDDLDRIFEPYSSAHEQSGRTDSIGLGLAVSRVLCEVMSGSLTGHVGDEGTTFRLELPRYGHCAAGPRLVAAQAT